MRLKVGDKVYTAATLGQPEIGDYLRLEQETAALGRRISALDAEEISNEIGSLKTDYEKKHHPDTVWLIALNVWASLCHTANQARDAGRVVEQVRFEDALQVSLDDMSFLTEPGDHKKPDPRKPRATQPSARGGGHPAAKRAAKTSKKRS